MSLTQEELSKVLLKYFIVLKIKKSVKYEYFKKYSLPQMFWNDSCKQRRNFKRSSLIRPLIYKECKYVYG